MPKRTIFELKYTFILLIEVQKWHILHLIYSYQSIAFKYLHGGNGRKIDTIINIKLKLIKTWNHFFVHSWNQRFWIFVLQFIQGLMVIAFYGLYVWSSCDAQHFFGWEVLGTKWTFSFIFARMDSFMFNRTIATPQMSHTKVWFVSWILVKWRFR